MKKNLLLIAIASAFALVSCGGASDDKKTDEDVQKPVCEVENSIAVTIQDYHFLMSDTLIFEALEFEVKASEYTWIDDSTVSIKLSNYTLEEHLGSKTADQLDIEIVINARKDKKLEAGYYGYHDYTSGHYSQVTLQTAYGKVWFNWISGMPEQGGITIEYLDKDVICGTFSLNVDKPENETIGIVKVNGTFVHKNVE